MSGKAWHFDWPAPERFDTPEALGRHIQAGHGYDFDELHEGIYVHDAQQHATREALATAVRLNAERHLVADALLAGWSLGTLRIPTEGIDPDDAYDRQVAAGPHVDDDRARELIEDHLLDDVLGLLRPDDLAVQPARRPAEILVEWDER
jgi:hypothetical protein